MVRGPWLVAPQTVEEVASTVRAAKSVITGNGLRLFAPPPQKVLYDSLPDAVVAMSAMESDQAAECTVDLSRLNGLVDYSPEDQVATFRSGTNLETVQGELLEAGQCLPFINGILEEHCDWVGGYRGPICESIGMNLPHGNEGAFGNWRDWTLGMRVVLADGTVVRCGSHAVKNVAGYDLQRLLVGARGSLGIVVEVTIRTIPLVALPTPETEVLRSAPMFLSHIQRVPLSEIDGHRVNLNGAFPDGVYAVDEVTGTFWLDLSEGSEPPRIDGDWLFSPLEPGMYLSPTQIRLMKRAKQIFDPTNKLNPGEWGFM